MLIKPTIQSNKSPIFRICPSLFLVLAAALTGCSQETKSADEQKKDIEFCRTVIDVITPDNKRCGPYLAMLKQEAASRSSNAQKTGSLNAKTAQPTTPSIRPESPVWAGGKMSLKCKWVKEQTQLATRLGEEKKESVSGEDFIVLDKTSSTASVGSTSYKANFSADKISWDKEDIENNVGKDETRKTSYLRVIDRKTLKYEGFDSYEVEGGSLGGFYIGGKVTGNCEAGQAPQEDPANKI